MKCLHVNVLRSSCPDETLSGQMNRAEQNMVKETLDTTVPPDVTLHFS